MLKPLPL